MSAVTGELKTEVGRGLGGCSLPDNLSTFPYPPFLLLGAGHNAVEINKELKNHYIPLVQTYLYSKLKAYEIPLLVKQDNVVKVSFFPYVCDEVIQNNNVSQPMLPMESLGKEGNLTFIEHQTAFDHHCNLGVKVICLLFLWIRTMKLRESFCLMLPSLQKGGSGVLRL